MDKKNANEMEQIQRGLEEFLEKELGQAGVPDNWRRGSSTGAQYRQRAERTPQELNSIQIIGQRRDTDDAEEGRIRREACDREEGYYQSGAYAREEEYSRGDAYTREEEDFRDDIGDSEEEDDGTEYDWDREPSRRPDYGRKREDARRVHHEREKEHSSGRSQSRSGEQVKGRGVTREAAPGEEDSQMAGKSSKASKTSKASNESKTPKVPNSQKKKRRKKHRLLKFLVAVAVIFVLLGVGLYQLVGVVYGRMTYHEIASVAGSPMQEKGVVNILLIGNDSRENGEDGRSDAMILLSISSKTKTIYMTSLLRDMYVDIPGHDGNRLNAAYSYGGAELLMETIEKNFDISVNRFVLVNFEAFAGLVDAVGGVELELSSEEIEYVNGYLVEYNMLTDRPQGTDNMDTSVSGLVHLNGPQALAYSRNRYLGTDFGRTDRQRKVLTAVIKKLPSALLTNAGGVLEGLMPNLTTNLTQGECFRLSLMAPKLLGYEIVSDSIPQPGTYRDATIRQMAVLEVDFEENIKYLKKKLYGEE